jgi:hypothetical protein
MLDGDWSSDVCSSDLDAVEAYRYRFERIEPLGTRDRMLRGRVVDTYAVYRLSGPRGAVQR